MTRPSRPTTVGVHFVFIVQYIGIITPACPTSVCTSNAHLRERIEDNDGRITKHALGICYIGGRPTSREYVLARVLSEGVCGLRRCKK